MVTNSTPQGPEAVAIAAAAAASSAAAGNDGQQSVAGQQTNGNLQPPVNGVNPIDSTITPNTLSALTGVINSMNAANGRQPDFPQNGQHQGYSQHPHPPPQQQQHMQHPDSYFSQQQQQQQQHHGYRPPSPGRQGHVHHMANGGHLPPHMLQSMGPQGHMQNMQSGQPITMPPSHLHGQEQGGYPQRVNVAASQAANGLFLLSQAHQELSKREEEMKIDAPRPGKGKRKSEDGGKAGRPAAANKKARKGSQAAPVPSVTTPVVHSSSLNGKGTSMSSGTSPEYMDDDDADPDSKLLEMAGYDQGGRQDSMAPSRSGSNQGKPETEEEKRKNFLERNRQGELIWRVRAS
jgi:ATF/CREB family transcription factor